MLSSNLTVWGEKSCEKPKSHLKYAFVVKSILLFGSLVVVLRW